MPLDKYAELLRSTVRHLGEAGANATVIITPPPIDEAARIKSRKEVSIRLISNVHADIKEDAGQTCCDIRPFTTPR